MIFLFGPLYSGKRKTAMQFLNCGEAEFLKRCIWDVQALAAQREDIEILADELMQYDAVIATEVGGGIVPLDWEERKARERAGRLNCLLVERAETVIRVFYGIPVILKGGKQ